MTAELIVVDGPMAGERFPLDTDEVQIGRAPDCQIRLDLSGIGWRHCAIRRKDGKYLVCDNRSGTGTFVNGLRVERHQLEPADQISIGSSVLAFREQQEAAPEIESRPALMNCCALLFLFRGLASSAGTPQHVSIERQLIRLIADWAPIEEGFVLLGSCEQELLAALAQRLPEGSPHTAAFRAAVAQACVQGITATGDGRLLLAPIYSRGTTVGLIALILAPAKLSGLGSLNETLAAIATLGGIAIESAQEVQRLRNANTLLTERLPDAYPIVGTSEALQKVVRMAERVAPLDTTVLILGESGTGKELVAHLLHRRSPRNAEPFVAINCAALSEPLLESELFGHEKGAFTGAVLQKKGKLELAEGGTVFLDEVGELAPNLQAKLLRVLQQREFERVGGTRTLRLNVRLIAATNRDLEEEAHRGAFRQDLYHRLNVVALRTPALRERPEDIPELARYFLNRAAVRCGRSISGIAPEAEQFLTGYSWPGNVRELENAMERAAVLGDTAWVLPEDLPDALSEVQISTGSMADSSGYAGKLSDARREALLRSWKASGGDYKKVAGQLGIHPNSVLRLIRRLGLRDQLPPGPR